MAVGGAIPTACFAILLLYNADEIAKKCIKVNSLQSMVKFFSGSLLLAVSILLVACSAQQDPSVLSEKERKLLLERVSQRWYAMEDKDYEKAYEYTTPNYRRVFSKALYVNKFSYGVDWELTGVELIHYDARAAVASVAVRVMSKPAKQTLSASIFGATPITLNESWIFVDGEWWHNAKD